MQSPVNLRRTAVGANMTPMIDVVFLLIIFFLVSSHLAKREARIPLQLPTASQQPQVDSSAGRLVLNLSADQSISVNGAVVEPQRLSDILRIHVAQYGDYAAIHIRAAASVQYEFTEPILRDAARAGIAKITFAVQERP